MILHLFYYQLTVLGLLWFFLMLYYLWPSPGGTESTPSSKPITTRHKRSHEPKVFAGLTHKPHCAACAHEATHPQPPPPLRPEPMPPTHRRPRTIATSRHFCPHAGCDYRGWLGLGNLRANGHPSGGPWRQLYCRSCHGYFLETHGTIFHGKRLSVELIVRVLACLAEGLGIRATARVFEVDPTTVLQWLVEAAEQLKAFSRYFLCDVHVKQFLTDGFKEYTTAILTHCGYWLEPIRRQGKGPMPKPRWLPRSQLLYAQVVKTVRRRRLVGVKHRVVFGTLEAIEQVLATCGWKINTAFVERLNLDIRQRVAAVGRRVNTLCQGEDGLHHQLVLFQAYHNFVLPHSSLRQPLLAPEPTNGTGSAKKWQPCTPAMVAGLTDHIWTLRAVLLYRVPPWPQPQMG
jgi:hypothetical protein